METAIKIKEAFSYDAIRLEIADGFKCAIVTVSAVNELERLYQMTNDMETRLVPKENKIEIRLYVK